MAKRTGSRTGKGSSSDTTRRVAGHRSKWVRQDAGHYVRTVKDEIQTTNNGVPLRYSRPYDGPGACTHSLATAGQPCPWCGVPQ